MEGEGGDIFPIYYYDPDEDVLLGMYIFSIPALFKKMSRSTEYFEGDLT